MNDDFCFVLTRHVHSAQTNRYWNCSIRRIRTFYPLKPIYIIDDHSNPEFVKPDLTYPLPANVVTYQVDKEWKGRGELLPYLYFLKYKWCAKAIFLHDSVFFNQRIAFEKLTMPVLSLWHHEYDQENVLNLYRIVKVLNHHPSLLQQLVQYQKPVAVLGFASGFSSSSSSSFHLCFGCQCMIQLSFLERLERKYNISRLAKVITCRADRCSLERILGLLFHQECSSFSKGSLLGPIMKHKRAFAYSFDDYVHDVKLKYASSSLFKKRLSPLLKVWTGR